MSDHVCDYRETARISNAIPGTGGIRTTVYLTCRICGQTSEQSY